jgi:lipopolysaccharide export system permease protein
MTDAELPARMVFRYILLRILPYINWLIPAAIMLATLYTMWQLSRNGELTAMRAGGISFKRITAPILAVATLGALLSLANTEFTAPHARTWTTELEKNNFKREKAIISRDVLHASTETRRQWVVGEIDHATPHILHDVEITQERPDHTRLQVINAERAEYLDGVWWLFSPSLKRYNTRDEPVAAPDQNPLNIAHTWSMTEFTEKPQDFIAEVTPWEEMSISAKIAYQRTHAHQPKADNVKRLFDIHRELATPWSSVIIALFAIPAGISTGRQGVMKGILMALGFFFAFYALSISGVGIANSMLVPPLFAAWLPNILFLTAGLFMLKRLN